MKLNNLSQEETDKILHPNTIILSYRGSIAHGMYVPNTDPNSIDDKDLLGVTIGSAKDYFGFGSFEQKEVFYKEYDSVIYELRKFIRLLYQSNPNVLSLLWTSPKHFMILNPIGKELIDNRKWFVSRKAYHSFTGYAYSQLKKMTSNTFNGYMGEKRKKLVEKFGYDTKNAAHLIRLLKMSIEYLKDGELYVDRGEVGDAPRLLEIKHGAWTLEQVKNEAERLFRLADETFTQSTLPQCPNKDAIESWLVDTLSCNV